MKIGTFDLESDGLLDEATRVWCCVLKDSNTKEVFKFGPDDTKAMLAKMDEYDVLKAHNGIGFDWPLLEKLYSYVYKGKKVDTVIMSRLLNPKRVIPPNCPNRRATPHGVEAWGWRVGRGKVEHHDWLNYSPEMLHRCAEDVEIQELIYEALMKEAGGGNWKNAFLLSFKLFENLQKQEAYGWLTDKPHMEECIRTLTRWMFRIDRAVTPYLPKIIEIEETKKDGQYNYVRKPFLKSGEYTEAVSRWCIGGNHDSAGRIVCGPFSRVSFRPTSLDSNEETKDFLLGMGWEPLEWNTDDTGKRTSPKLSKDDPFEGIDGKLGKLVAKRVQCRHRRSSIEGLLGIVREDGRIGAAVNTLAVTGRATHRNIVNIPAAKSFFGKQMRQCFISKPGYVLVGCDSDANQIRMLCGRMNDPVYTDNVLNGRKEDGTDIHSVNMRAAGLPNRDAAKTFFYGFLFGAGDAKVGKIVGGGPAQGRALKDKFFAGLPALGELMQRLQGEWKSTARKSFNPKFGRMGYKDGTITGLDGRPIVVPSEHQLLVYLLQSDEAIMMSAAYNRVHKTLANAGLVYGEDFGCVIFYHDEYEFEVKEEHAKLVAKHCEDAIKWAGEFYKIPCPHLGHAAIGSNWYDIH